MLMKKRILALVLAAIMAGSLATCSSSPGTDTKAAPIQTEAPAPESRPEVKEESKAEEGDAVKTASSKGDAEGYELTLATDSGIIDDKPSNQGAWEGLKRYVEENSISYKYYQPQEGTTGSYLETIGLTTEDGAKLVVCPGFLFEESTYTVQDKYPDVYFILLDGEPHDADYNYKTNSNTMPILFQEDQAGFLAGYAAVKDGYTKLGFMGGMAVSAVIRFEYGFIQDAEFAAEEDTITGPEIICSYTGASSATPETQSMTASWYQDGTEVIFGCGGTVGDSVMAATQEENTGVIGVDVDRGTRSETVIMSATKLLSNSVYDEVKDFYNGGLPGGRTFVFTATNNGVGIPVDTSRFEKSSREQYDAIYEKIINGEITLVQFSTDNNGPTGDLAGLTNTKVIFVEQGLVESVGCIRA